MNSNRKGDRDMKIHEKETPKKEGNRKRTAN